MNEGRRIPSQMPQGPSRFFLGLFFRLRGIFFSLSFLTAWRFVAFVFGDGPSWAFGRVYSEGRPRSRSSVGLVRRRDDLFFPFGSLCEDRGGAFVIMSSLLLLLIVAVVQTASATPIELTKNPWAKSPWVSPKTPSESVLLRDLEPLWVSNELGFFLFFLFLSPPLFFQKKKSSPREKFAAWFFHCECTTLS